MLCCSFSSQHLDIKNFRCELFCLFLFSVYKLQIGTPWSDGTEGVTQCPIFPGDTFIYKFVVDRVSFGNLNQLMQ